MRIALIGGHGKVALLAHPLLADAGHEVDAIIRNPEHESDVSATRANPVVADVETLEVDSLVELLRGYDAVIWSAGAGGGSPQRTYAVDRDAAIRSMDAAEQAGVRRYVMVSYYPAGRPERPHDIPEDNAFYPYAESKAAADAHLRDSALDWTIIGPSALTLEAPTGQITINTDPTTQAATQVSRANVAAVIAAVIENPRLSGVTIEFNDGDTPIQKALDSLAR